MHGVDLRRILICGGDCKVSANAVDLFCTVFGSCIAACIYDPVAGIGGMNHYLLPRSKGDGRSARYGEEALPMLVERLCRSGAVAGRLRAKIYGGAATLVSDTDIGQMNIDMARGFLASQRIEIADTDLGGRTARWIKFHPATGRSYIKVAPDRALPAARHALAI